MNNLNKQVFEQKGIINTKFIYALVLTAFIGLFMWIVFIVSILAGVSLVLRYWR